jgi:peptide/nickel transport system substrate-binding protein
MSLSPEGSPRRAFTRLWLPILVSVVLVVSACTSKTSDSPANAGNKVVTYAVPALGGEDFMCPKCSQSAAANLDAMFDTLLERDPATGKIREGTGRLASEWSHNADFTKFTFKIRKGVPFHDGWGDVTAQDVLFSWNLMMSKGSLNPSVSTFKNFTAATPDADTFEIVSGVPNPGVTELLTDIQDNFVITSKKYVEKVGEQKAATHPIGTGPFKFKSWTPGVSISFERVDHHWRHTPQIAGFRILAVADEQTRLADIQNGTADIAAVPNFTLLKSVKDAGLKTLAIENQSMPVIYLTGNYVDPKYPSAEAPPWSDTAHPDSAKLVRHALSAAINREEIVKFVMGGEGGVDGACTQSYFPTSPGYDKNCKPEPFDPDKARSLLAEAGYKSPGDLTVLVDTAVNPVRPWCADIMKAVGQQWSNLGIKVKYQLTDYNQFEASTQARTAHAAFCYAPPSSFSGPTLLSFYSLSTGRLAYTGESPELDKLVLAATQAFDPATIESTAVALREHVAENYLGLPIALAPQIYMMNPKLDWAPVGGGKQFVMSRQEFMTWK